MPVAESYAPGEQAERCEVGDFILTHRGRWAGAAIRWGQRLRLRGPDRLYAYWNHAALVVSRNGDLVEALTRTGATRSHIAKYREVEYTVVRTCCAPHDQAQIVVFADRMVGEPYGWLNDLSVGLAFVTGWKLTFAVQESVMCSGLVARALERAGAYFDRLPETVCPADLAKFYDVKPEAV